MQGVAAAYRLAARSPLAKCSEVFGRTFLHARTEFSYSNLRPQLAKSGGTLDVSARSWQLE